MGVLQDRTAAQEWFECVSGMYEPVVAGTFWPCRLQRRLVDSADLGPDDHVLDVGCGTGLTSRLLAGRAGQVTGIDISRRQLDAARRRAVGARFVRGDAARLPFAPDTFDAVVSVGAVLYFPDPVTAFAEARRVTRPGGSVLVAGFNRPRPSWNPGENWVRLANETFFCTYDREEAHAMFRTAGWSDVASSVTGPAWHPRLTIVTTANNAPKATRNQPSGPRRSG